LIKLIERSPLDGIKSSRLLNNYYFFVEMLKKKELIPKEIYEGIGKLQIVNITLDRTTDDAQLIFESLNSTGMELSHSDLIRNYVLMGLEPDTQQNIYNNYWFLMESKFDYEKQSLQMDNFFRDYLSLKNGKITAQTKVYEEFKIYHRNVNTKLITEFCKDLLEYSIYYTNMLNAKTGDKQLDGIFRDIRDLQMDVALPFLLKVYSDYALSKIDKDSFCTILRICESYVLRRHICGIPTNSLNKTFMLAVNKINPDDYLNSIKVFFILLDTYKVFPGNDEFLKELKLKDMYNTRIINYFLSKLENHQNKAPINIANYTIEHIMPQNKELPEAWKDDLGKDWQEIQKTYLHTIGNLTLTAYNSEMSDLPFQEKLTIKGGFKESALRINSFIINQTIWNKDKIEERAEELGQLITEIWSYPDVDNETLKKYDVDKTTLPNTAHSLQEFEYLQGGSLALFELLNKRIMNIAVDVKRVINKLYIAYKVDSNFVDIVPQKSNLRLFINMKYSEVYDPKGICVDMTDKGSWGNGDVAISLSNSSKIDDAMDIILQSYNKQED
jgi:predicted transport protein